MGQISWKSAVDAYTKGKGNAVKVYRLGWPFGNVLYDNRFGHCRRDPGICEYAISSDDKVAVDWVVEFPKQ